MKVLAVGVRRHRESLCGEGWDVAAKAFAVRWGARVVVVAVAVGRREWLR
ncbi:hypothetical protein Ade02nite_77940 [Paractinoplanes deccanensis]|uniref:Uncharacterized protein n=1 Tax=Paractinoplanes deccanensis TaxID=113561 RepID=A0ABQ3YGN6_9ACTN|nr:hypothetical protein [Actinoplanes deccanensis]GID79153.1 hypothetical protein Ade02nite_77940 [Actinoplanes deccanensis]